MKISPYKKLKQENESLKADLYNILRNPYSPEGITAKHRWNLMFQMQENFLYGTRETFDHATWNKKEVNYAVGLSPYLTKDNNKIHECQYCGIMTTQADDECYKAPLKSGT